MVEDVAAELNPGGSCGELRMSVVRADARRSHPCRIQRIFSLRSAVLQDIMARDDAHGRTAFGVEAAACNATRILVYRELAQDAIDGPLL